MTFHTDHGGYKFSCSDVKFSLKSASTWNTRLSQLGKTDQPLRIMTKLLPGQDYLDKIFSKRPHDIYIIAYAEAQEAAAQLKKAYPQIRIAIHSKMNAKVALLGPDKVWLTSSDFGESKLIESTVGFHSVTLYEEALKDFKIHWDEATELF